MVTVTKALATQLAELLPLIPGYKERKTSEGYFMATSVRLAEAHAEKARRAAAKTPASIAPAAPTPTAPSRELRKLSLWERYHQLHVTERRDFWKSHEREMSG